MRIFAIWMRETYKGGFRMQAWFRELPTGVLDSLSPEQVLACHGEKDSLALIKQLPPTEAALLDWAINLMADVVELESLNKMNARNIAMVFAPNMTQVQFASATSPSILSSLSQV